MTNSIKNKVCDSTEYTEVPIEPIPEKPNLNGDWLNFFVLIVLYIIQGFPVGFTFAVSNILQSKKLVTYEDQALFSIAFWPYWMKLFWAPIVDAFYVQWIGRRKSWLLSVQLLTSSLLFYMASNIEDWLSASRNPNIKMLACVVFCINFLAATQDIVVDGWSLTMLKKKNISHSSTCSTVGVIFGMFIGSVCFTLLVSEEFNNKHFRTTPGTGGIISIKSFLYACAIFVLLVSISIGTLKKEKDNRLENGYVKINVLQSYQLLWSILKLPPIKILTLALLTTRISYTTMDGSILNLKLIDAGVSKDDLMIINTGVYILQFSMPFLVSKYTTSSRPLSCLLNIAPIRLLWAFASVALIYFTPSLIHKSDVVHVPAYYYLILGLVIALNEVMSILMSLTLVAFFCRISDPRFGGTYMTLFNTFYFLGFLVSNTMVLKVIGVLTFSQCSKSVFGNCSTANLKEICKSNGGTCQVYVDGYYVAVVFCVIIGFIWFTVFRKTLKNYQSMSLSHWLVNDSRYNTAKTDAT